MTRAKPRKETVVELVVEQLEKELVNARAAAQSSREAATAEENRPENQFDTRALEASFLARGQAARVAEYEQAIRVLRELPLKPLPEDAPVQTGALVLLSCDDAELWHIVLPAGAGLAVETGGTRVSVVTSSSPLGTELLGKTAGDSFTFRRGGAAKEYELLGVS